MNLNNLKQNAMMEEAIASAEISMNTPDTDPVHDFFTAPDEVRRPVYERALEKAQEEQEKQTTPDTEWEKEFDEMWKILDYEVCMRVKTHGTQRLEDYVQAEPEDIKAFITSLITSVKQERDTYWKERVEEAYDKGFTAGMEVAEEQHTGRVLTNEDNLK